MGQAGRPRRSRRRAAFLLVGAAGSFAAPADLPVLWPLRLAASLLLGPAALDPEAPLGPTAVTGALVHLLLSAVFRVGFAALVAPRRQLRRSLPALLGAGALCGLGLWRVNVYAVAPSYGWTWVPAAADARAQGFVHALGFGPALALALHLAAVPRRRLGLD